MRTIRIKLYKFNELSKSAKQKAIENYRNSDNYFDYSDIEGSVKAVIELFNLKTGRTWDDIRTSHIDDSILELKGIRLATYLWNNYKTELFKGKYFSLWSKTEKSYKHYKEGYPVLKSRHSKVILNNDCTLTGVSFDNDILQPVYDFLKKPDVNTTFEDLIKDIENAISKCYRDTEEWINSDEYITETIEANDYEFTQDGKLS